MTLHPIPLFALVAALPSLLSAAPLVSPAPPTQEVADAMLGTFAQVVPVHPVESGWELKIASTYTRYRVSADRRDLYPDTPELFVYGDFIGRGIGLGLTRGRETGRASTFLIVANRVTGSEAQPGPGAGPRIHGELGAVQTFIGRQSGWGVQANYLEVVVVPSGPGLSFPVFVGAGLTYATSRVADDKGNSAEGRVLSPNGVFGAAASVKAGPMRIAPFLVFAPALIPPKASYSSPPGKKRRTEIFFGGAFAVDLEYLPWGLGLSWVPSQALKEPGAGVTYEVYALRWRRRW